MPIYYPESKLFAFNVPGQLWHSEIMDDGMTKLFVKVEEEDQYNFVLELLRVVEIVEDQND